MQVVSSDFGRGGGGGSRIQTLAFLCHVLPPTFHNKYLLGSLNCPQWWLPICLSSWMCTATDWWSVQDLPYRLPEISSDRHQLTLDAENNWYWKRMAANPSVMHRSLQLFFTQRCPPPRREGATSKGKGIRCFWLAVNGVRCVHTHNGVDHLNTVAWPHLRNYQQSVTKSEAEMLSQFSRATLICLSSYEKYTFSIF